MTTTTKTMQTSQGSKIQFQPNQQFDGKKMRHYVNGQTSVLHCHHYASLFSQLADDAQDFQGPKLLADASCETFGQVLCDYFKKNNVTDTCDRIAIAEQYCVFSGMGEIQFQFGPNSGTAVMSHCHVDEGWVKKWGQRDKPVNFIGQGFIQGCWGAIFDRQPSECKVEETQSIVCGAGTSQFTINW